MGAVYVFLIATLLFAAVFASPQRKSDVEERFDVYQNGEKIGYEDLKFDKESGLIMLKGDDGSFTIQDINKALMIKKYAGDAMCYLSAMETGPNEGEAVEEMIRTSQQSFTTKQVEITTDDITYRTLSGEVKDTRFLPETAVERCELGFKWRIQTGEAIQN